jgi:hypothetical protein
VSVNASCNDATKCKTKEWVAANTTANQSCPSDQVLPCFLRFTQESLPKDDNSNMRCKLIARRAPDDARAACSAGQYPFSLESEGQNLPEISRTASEQSWVIDPAYYQYRGCTCLLVSLQNGELGAALTPVRYDCRVVLGALQYCCVVLLAYESCRSTVTACNLQHPRGQYAMYVSPCYAIALTLALCCTTVLLYLHCAMAVDTLCLSAVLPAGLR